MGIAALLIDFGGTLDADGTPWVDRFYAAYQQAGGSVDLSTFRAAFATSDDRLAQWPGIQGCDYRETVVAQRDILAPLLADGDCLAAPAVVTTLLGDAMAVAKRNRPVLERLRSDYRLAVVSNFQGNLQPCLEQLGLGDAFDVVSDSELVGVRKPDPRIFDITLERLGAAAGDCWMIGDSPPNDIAAGQALGMRTCWIAPASRALPGIRPTERVARFVDVPDAIAA